MSRKKPKPPWLDHGEVAAASLRRDPGFAEAYLNAVLLDQDQGELLVALNHLTRAFGGISAVAGRARLNPTSLYRSLSKKGNPELRSLMAVLDAMDLRLAVRPAPVGRPQSGTRPGQPARSGQKAG